MRRHPLQCQYTAAWSDPAVPASSTTAGRSVQGQPPFLLECSTAAACSQSIGLLSSETPALWRAADQSAVLLSPLPLLCHLLLHHLLERELLLDGARSVAAVAAPRAVRTGSCLCPRGVPPPVPSFSAGPPSCCRSLCLPGPAGRAEEQGSQCCRWSVSWSMRSTDKGVDVQIQPP
jgi:hypothetical protein